MKYFEAYEARRNLYKKVLPGTLWRNKAAVGFTILVESVDYESKTISGRFNGRRMTGLDPIEWLRMTGLDPIEWLLRFYELES